MNPRPSPLSELDSRLACVTNSWRIGILRLGRALNGIRGEVFPERTRSLYVWYED